jgi:hypothetical protein
MRPTNMRPGRGGFEFMELQQVLSWLRRLAQLDTRVFDEARSTPSATIPGAAVVLIASLFAGIGGWLWWMLNDYPRSGDILVHSAILGSIASLVVWTLGWLGVVYAVLTQIFRQRAFLEQLMRVMGLASAPLALMLFMFIPAISLGIGLAALALTFGLTSIAIKRVTTADEAQVLVANTLGFLVWSIIMAALASSSSAHPHAPGVFLYQTVQSIMDDFLSGIPAILGGAG